MNTGGDRWEQRETERRLAAKMNEAYNRYLLLHVQFTRLIEGAPTGAIGSDGLVVSHRFKSLGERQREALAEYSQALAEFVDFVKRGKTPEPPGSE